MQYNTQRLERDYTLPETDGDKRFAKNCSIVVRGVKETSSQKGDHKSLARLLLFASPPPQN